MSSSFDRHPRKLQELRGRPFADEVYKRELGAVEISRLDQGDGDRFLLDKEFAIDVILKMPTGHQLTGQEKFLSYQYEGFNSVTVQYLEDPLTGKPGDWFTGAFQFYFVAYFNHNNTGWLKWAILNWVNIVLATRDGDVLWHDQENKYSDAKSTLRWCKVDLLPIDCVVAQQGFRIDRSE